jgi:oxidase EvaA
MPSARPSANTTAADVDPSQRDRAEEYAGGLERYRESVASLPFDPTASPTRIEHQFECLRDWSLFHTVDEVRDWFLGRRRHCGMKIEDIPLRDTRGWIIDPDTGNVTHESGEFFSVHGIRVTESSGREVGARGWDQPILEQIGYDGGLLGILRKRFLGVPHYLIEAKAEPGNYEVLQLSPTLQATFSNLRRAHKGRKPRFAEYFEDPGSNEATVLYRQWLSEDGGRLHKKRNMGMLVEVPEAHQIPVPEGFLWLSMYQIKALLQENALVNPHIRGIIAHL